MSFLSSLIRMSRATRLLTALWAGLAVALIPPPSATAETVVTLNDTVVREDVVPLGIHFSGDNYWESPMMRKRVQENFEGSVHRTVSAVTVLASNRVRLSTAIDQSMADAYVTGPTTYMILSGADAFKTGAVTSVSYSGTDKVNVELTLDSAFTPHPSKNGILIDTFRTQDVVVKYHRYTDQQLEMNSFYVIGDAAIAVGEGYTRFGENALRLNAASSQAGYRFVTHDSEDASTRGLWRVRFRYRATNGSPSITVDFDDGVSHTQTGLTSAWALYDRQFNYNPSSEPNRQFVEITAQNGVALIDDVEIEILDSTNPTAFRDDFIDALTALNPGTARYLVNKTDRLENRLGTKLDIYGMRASASFEKVDFGMHEFFELAEHVGFQPWYTLPGSLGLDDMERLMEWLAGPADVGWGAKRAAAGHPAPWTDTITRVLLQFGNEHNTFPGTGYNGPDYWEGLIAAAKASPWYNDRIVFITDVQGGAQNNISVTPNTDLVCMGSYLNFGLYSNMIASLTTPQKEAEYLFSVPWQFWTSDHKSTEDAQTIVANGLEPSIYEGGNFHTTFGDVTAEQVDRQITSYAGGISGVHAMLLMLELYGARAQNSFNLSQGSFAPGGSFGDIEGRVSLWGGLLIMREENRRWRPRLLAMQVANKAAGGDLIASIQSGPDQADDITVNGQYTPAYSYRNSPLSSTVVMKPIASYAFREDGYRGLILFNQDVYQGRSVRIEDAFVAPGAAAEWWKIAPSDLMANNENESSAPPVGIVSGQISGFTSGHTVVLEPGAMMALRWPYEVIQAPPAFLSDPISKSQAVVGEAYAGSIADDAADPNWDDVLAFTKAGGPGWLQVAADGGLSGTPSIDDVGANAFTVQVDDGNGGMDTATLMIEAALPLPLGAITVIEAAEALAGVSGTQSASFTASHAGAPGNYLIVGAVSESAYVTAMSFGGVPMTKLFQAQADGSAYAEFFGLATAAVSGQIVATYSGNIFGTQIFGYAFLDGVDTTAPLRATGIGANPAGTGSVNVSYTAAAESGDFALLLANQNNRTWTPTVSPVDQTLYSGAAGATFSGMAAYDADLPAGAYGSAFAFNGGVNRELAGGVILASQSADPDADSDEDGIPDWYEQLYSGSKTGLDPESDDDHDGADAFAEWMALTDAANSNSLFRFLGVAALSTGAPVVQWRSSTGRVYALHRRIDPGAASALLGQDLPATPPLNAYTDTTHATESGGFYAVDVTRTIP